MRCFHDFSEQVKLHIEEVRKLIPLTKRSGLNKSHYLVKYFGVAYDDFRKEVWVSFGISKLGLTEKSSNMSKKFREINFYCNFTSFLSIRVKTRSITMVKHQIICTFLCGGGVWRG